MSENYVQQCNQDPIALWWASEVDSMMSIIPPLTQANAGMPDEAKDDLSRLYDCLLILKEKMQA